MQTVDLNKITLHPGDRILDAGCGSGRHLSEAFRRKGVHVIGIDMNVGDLTQARNTLRIMETEGESGQGRWGTYAADITDLPFRDQSFDFVICSEVLEHIPEDHKAVSEIIRVLKDGHFMAVSVPRYFPESVCWALSRDYRNEPGGHIRIYKKQQLTALLESHGLHCLGEDRAHALHSPYWWLKCLVGHKNDDHRLVRLYHKLLVWDIIKHPWLTQTLDYLLNPLISKSTVLYLKKEGY